MAGGRGERLFPLTREVAKPAVTFGGIYKIIDFTLSNCFNTGIRQIYLLTQYSNVTMNRHVRLGWNPVFRLELDEFIEALPPQHIGTENWYHGTADSIYQNINLLERHKPDYVLILSGDHVYKMDYGKMLDYHIDKQAEMTVAVVPLDRLSAREMGVIGVDDEFRVREFVEKPADPPAMPGHPDQSLASMGVYVFTTTKLVRELIRDSKDSNSRHDFGRNIIPNLVANHEPIFAYPFRDGDSGSPAYWRDIGTLDSFYTTNLDLVTANPAIDLYDRRWPIRTYTPQTPPARIVDSTIDRGREGVVVDSLVSSGSVISGARVVRSVLSPEVKVHTGAEVSDSILMEGVDIGRHAVVRRAIICTGVRVPEHARIGVDENEDRARFIVTEGRVTVVPEGYVW
ncbi:glucose-1-phosphate adenylyltransferase [candidate division KSB1 bacterium]|nr:glucose-1-phosphate adenylyltransferase [candidate division KSB1 bacterium]